MPVLGIILGLILAVWISIFTLFNDGYLQQPLMTGNLMPTSVYGPAVLLALVACGTMWRRLGERELVSRRDLVALIVIATAACAWPGTNFLRTFVGSTGYVANLAKTHDNWTSAEVLSYVPEGLLLAEGQDTPGVTDTLNFGVESTPVEVEKNGEVVTEQRQLFALDNVPWAEWWPVLRIWGGLALLFGLASVCMGVIVHPQWSRYERLPYPLVRFIEELSKPNTGPDPIDPESRGRPAVLRNKLFWIGLGGVAGVHLLNGLWAWEIEILRIPVQYDLTPLKQLFPLTANLHGTYEFYEPHLYFSVIAFVFFIRGDVSFSVGVSIFVWIAVAAAFVARGEWLGSNPAETDNSTLLRAGAYLGFAVMILVLGRHYYLRVLAGAVGLGKARAEHPAGVWAMRGLGVTLAGSVWMLARYADLDWRLGLMLMVCFLAMMLILARLSAETGMFYLEPNWIPLVVISAFLGFEGLGPAAFITVALASNIVLAVPREPLMGYVSNGLQLSERLGKGRRTGRTGLSMAAVATATLGLAITATLVLAHTRGVSPHEGWANRSHPTLAFNALARRVSEAASLEQLDDIIAAANAGHFSAAVPDSAALGWLLLGVALVVGCTVARLRLAWWPIHPVLFFMFGSMAGLRLAWSFLIGWAIRQAIIRLGGVKAFQATLPLAVGAIAGELLAALGWQLCGSIYYFYTGLSPSGYFILPR